MGKYLIVKCVDLNDQYECDANRIPLVLVDDYVEWLRAHGKDSEWYEIYQEGLLGKMYLDCTYRRIP